MPDERGFGGTGPGESVHVGAGYLHQTPGKSEEPEACPSCEGAEDRKHLGDDVEPHCSL